MKTGEEERDGANVTRKPYSPPRLTVHGDVATLTQQDHGASGCKSSRKDCGSGDGQSRLQPWGTSTYS
jgi:hypothetical protein